MSRYKPKMIDGVAGLSLGSAGAGTDDPDEGGSRERSDAHHRNSPSGPASGPAMAALARARSALAGPAMIAGEPDSERGTLAEWRAWRARLLNLPRDESVRLALAVAEARIAKLRQRAGE